MEAMPTARSRKAASSRPRARAARNSPRRSRPKRQGIVVGVGLATVDMLCVAPRMDERIVELSVFSIQGGGSVATGLATLAMLGAKTRFFGRVGDDEFGRFVMNGLSALSVDVASASIEPGKVSPVSLVQIEELTRKRKI